MLSNSIDITITVINFLHLSQEAILSNINDAQGIKIWKNTKRKFKIGHTRLNFRTSS